MIDYKKLFGIIKETDNIVDLNPDLKEATEKILKELIKKIHAGGGAIVAYDFLDSSLKAIAKVGPLSHKMINDCFRKGKMLANRKKITIPIILNKRRLGVIYFFGKNFTKEDVECLSASENILDGRFKHEAETVSLRNIFERYVDEKTMRKILKNPDKKHITGERRVCSILFADINGFSEYVNKNKSGKIVNFLNNYFEEMSKIVLKHGGTIDKFIGDEIMAIFGSPVPLKNHSSKAILAAKEMIKKMRELSKKYNLNQGGLSIGIATGRVVSGNIGYEKMMDYTVVGKKVNLASRLTKSAGKNQIFVDKDTKKSAKSFTYKSMGKKEIKGFGKIEINRVVLNP